MVKKDENGITIPMSVFRNPIVWLVLFSGISALGVGGFGIANGTAQASEIQVKVARNEAVLEALKDDIHDIKRSLRDINRKMDKK